MFWPTFLAEVFLAVDDYDAALTQLKQQLSGPSLISGKSLPLDPANAPLATDARFQKLVETESF